MATSILTSGCSWSSSLQRALRLAIPGDALRVAVAANVGAWCAGEGRWERQRWGNPGKVVENLGLLGGSAIKGRSCQVGKETDIEFLRKP